MNNSDYLNIDPSVLLLTVGDKTLFVALSKIFLDQAPPILDALKSSIESADCSAAAIQSHALKGMTVLVGASELTALLQQVETAARQELPIVVSCSTLGSTLAAVLHEVERSITEASSGL